MLSPASSGNLTEETRKGLEAALDDFRLATAEMVRVMDEKSDLIKAAPASFADTIKKTHASLWEERLNSITSAISQLK